MRSQTGIQKMRGSVSQIKLGERRLAFRATLAKGLLDKPRKSSTTIFNMAQGSLSELDTQLELARKLKYLDEQIWITLDQQMDRIDKMISGLIRRQPPPSRLTPTASRGVCGFSTLRMVG